MSSFNTFSLLYVVNLQHNKLVGLSQVLRARDRRRLPSRVSRREAGSDRVVGRAPPPSRLVMRTRRRRSRRVRLEAPPPWPTHLSRTLASQKQEKKARFGYFLKSNFQVRGRITRKKSENKSPKKLYSNRMVWRYY